MNNFDFIEQIRIRPVLWDQTHYNDLTTKEDVWDEVGQMMGCSKEVLKARWKNLRDTYRKIIRKNGVKDIGSTWPYYKAMQFMHNILANSKTKVMDITTKASTSETDYSYNVTLEQQESDGGTESMGDGHADVLKRRGVKREADDESITEYLEIEQEKPEPCPRNRIDDDDCQFLLSLLPHIRQVPLNRKLPLRVKIEQLIYDEAYRNNY